MEKSVTLNGIIDSVRQAVSMLKLEYCLHNFTWAIKVARSLLLPSQIAITEHSARLIKLLQACKQRSHRAATVELEVLESRIQKFWEYRYLRNIEICCDFANCAHRSPSLENPSTSRVRQRISHCGMVLVATEPIDCSFCHHAVLLPRPTDNEMAALCDA